MLGIQEPSLTSIGESLACVLTAAKGLVHDRPSDVQLGAEIHTTLGSTLRLTTKQERLVGSDALLPSVYQDYLFGAEASDLPHSARPQRPGLAD